MNAAARNLALTAAAAPIVLLLRIVVLREFLGPLGWFAGSRSTRFFR